MLSDLTWQHEPGLLRMPEERSLAFSPTGDGLPEPGQLVGGKYRVERAIGRGGMGAVFAARNESTGRLVALKWLVRTGRDDAEATHRLIREARAAARVRHPHVVDVYDIGEHQGSLFLVMELLEGETLSSLLARKGRLALSEALAVLLPVMRGIEVAHRSHVIHRDLKPSNIFLSQDEVGAEPIPRLLDFGISKVARTPDDNDESLTRTGAVIGTPFYMAPEQLGDGPVDARIDVYALGVILYQVLSGRLPFYDSSYNNLIVKIATATPEPLHEARPDLPRACCDAVMRAMARDRDARFASVAALIQALAPFQAEHAKPAPSSVAPKRPTRAAVLAVIGIVALGVAAWLAQGWLVPEPSRTAPQIALEAVPPPEPAPPARASAFEPIAPPPPAAVEPVAPVKEEGEPAKPEASPPRRRPSSNKSSSSAPSSPPAIKVSRDQF